MLLEKLLFIRHVHRPNVYVDSYIFLFNSMMVIYIFAWNVILDVNAIIAEKVYDNFIV